MALRWYSNSVRSNWPVTSWNSVIRPVSTRHHILRACEDSKVCNLVGLHELHVSVKVEQVVPLVAADSSSVQKIAQRPDNAERMPDSERTAKMEDTRARLP